MDLSISGDLTASPGQKISGDITIGTSYDNTTIPITLINGVEDGPTMVVLSGIHGSEYIPIIASQRLANDLDPSTIRGSLILVHIANLQAYLGRTVYINPIDGKNLNRVFPGNSDGTLSEQIANFLVQQVYPIADCVLDMHSGDANEQLGPSYTAYYGRAGSPELIQASKGMAFAFGLNLVVEFQWELEGVDDNTSTAIWAGSAAVVRNVPSIDVEMAPGMGSTYSDSIEHAYQGVLRVMNHLEMFQTKPEVIKDKAEKNPCLVRDRIFLESPMRGSWTPLIDTGNFVKKGTILGYITDFYGKNRTFELMAPSDGLLLIRIQTPPVLEADTLAVIALLNSSDVVCEHLKLNGPIYTRNAETISKSLILWKWFAATGWLFAFGTVIGMMRTKVSKRRSCQHDHIPANDEGTMDGIVV